MRGLQPPEREADYLNGEIARLGRQHDVPTPVNAVLQRLVADAARTGAKPGGWMMAEPEARIAAHALQSAR